MCQFFLVFLGCPKTHFLAVENPRALRISSANQLSYTVYTDC